MSRRRTIVRYMYLFPLKRAQKNQASYISKGKFSTQWYSRHRMCALLYYPVELLHAISLDITRWGATLYLIFFSKKEFSDLFKIYYTPFC